MKYMQKKQLGFTLIELTITIILIGILSVGVFLNWSGSKLNVYAEARKIAADISYAQSMAMTSGQRYRFVKISNSSYQIQNNSGTPINFLSGQTITLNKYVTFGSFTNLPNNLINFDGNGVPYTDTASPGTALASTAVINLSTSGQTTTVSIAPITGRATTP